MTTSMSSIILDVTAIVTASVGWVGQYLTVIEEKPLLLMFVIVPFVGLGIGLLKRLIKL